MKIWEKTFGCNRLVYNHYLEKVKDVSVRNLICLEYGSYHGRDYNAVTILCLKDERNIIC